MREKLPFTLCIVIAVCFVVALGGAVAMSFADSKMLLGKLVIASLVVAAGSIAVLVGSLFLDAST